VPLGAQPPVAACPHRPPCPACPRFGDARLALAARAARDELGRMHGLDSIPLVSGAAEGFRHRARLAVRGRVGAPKLGLFELGSHRVVHIPNCRVHHPLINRVAGIVRRALAEARLTSYSDQAHLGLARYLQVVIERRTQSAQLVLVGNSAVPEPFAPAIALIRERLGADLHSLWYNANTGVANAILGSEFQLICGPAAVCESFGGAEVHYPPGAFGQSNLDLAERLIEHVRVRVPAGARVAEFYAGVGAIGLSLVAQVGAIAMNELAPQSLRGLQRGLDGLDGASRAKIALYPGAAGEACAALHGADVVIVDPPRKGLDQPLLRALCTEAPPRLLYVSCDLESFARDAARLTDGGALRLTELTAFDFAEHHTDKAYRGRLPLHDLGGFKGSYVRPAAAE